MLPSVKVLFGWEIGAGMGHLAPHRALLEQLRDAGHQVSIVARDVARAHRAFAGSGFRVWPAPFSLDRPDPLFRPTASVAQVLHNSGWGDESALYYRCLVWDQLLEACDPDIVIVDFAPTLQLALRGSGLRVVNLSNGFLVPPAGQKTPIYWTLRPHLKVGPASDDAQVVATANRVLERRGRAQLRFLADVFHEQTTVLLKTYPDLDHFPGRFSSGQSGGSYVGTPPSPRGLPADFPNNGGPKIFGYLKPFAGIESLFEVLSRGKWSTLIAADGLPSSLQQRYASSALQFSSGPVDLWSLKGECALAINNANHGSTAHLLFNGTPILAVPLQLEQELVAGSLAKLGVGGVMTPGVKDGIERAIDQLIGETRFRRAAESFAARNAEWNMGEHLQRVLLHLEASA